ncbi:MAG: hypothetical protein WA871_08025 [Candidatus Acidiferrales bacterium]
MKPNSDQEPSSPLRNPLLYSTAMLVVVALVVGYIFFSRWEANRAAAERAAEKTRAQDQRIVDAMGGDNFKILNFYASPISIHPGDTAELCYGVANAKQVSLDPPAGAVWPSYSRCVDVSPHADTTYTLTAQDAAGHTKTATVTLRVH